MFDIITFGSASRDIFLKSKDFSTISNRKFITGQGICLTLGSKIDVEEMSFYSGGGGTNTAAGFSKQGFRAAYCGMLGQDLAGESLIEELQRFKIDTSLVKKHNQKPTNHSIVFSLGKERTILVYRGASEELSKKDIPWSKLKARWFYLAPLAGKLANLTENLVSFAKTKKIKVALNPSRQQLSLPFSVLKNILNKIDILILNQEEASLLTKIPYQKEKEIFKKIDQLTKGITIMTKGEKGAMVSDGRYLYTAPILETAVVDKTGAGDAFGSGFVSGIMEKNDIVYAVQLAIANSAFSLKKQGAKEGLLGKNQKWEKVKVRKESCFATSLCQTK